MSAEIYDKVYGLAMKDFRKKTSKGQYPYLWVLDEILSNTKIVSEENLGLVDIPLNQIVGTKTAERTKAFAGNFMPLLTKDSEFATKWCRLYEAHIKEGIQEPVKAYEFMNRFYIMEGNKRVSVLKYCDAVTVSAFVTRLIPEMDDSDESKVYYEFLSFYEKTGINYLNFSQLGSYIKITQLADIELDHTWTDMEKEQFHSSYIRFTKVFEKKNGNTLPLTYGDAFLIYLDICGYENMLEKGEAEIEEEIKKLWNDFAFYPEKPEIRLLMNVESAAERKSFVKRILPLNSEPLKIAFIHAKTVETSSWTYGHDLGCGHLKEVLAAQIEIQSYFQADSPEEEIACFEQAIADGNTVIFSTSPKLLDTSIRFAVKYPKLKILNCSLNTSCNHLRTYYGRLYEAKFLIGAIAGVMSHSDKIGYIADYPIYGMIANINAFALGAQMVNPQIKVYLKWSKTKSENSGNNLEDIDISFISGKDFIRPEEDSTQFGLYNINGDELVNLAMPVWNWGVFYEQTVRSILNGTWKQEVPKGGNQSINYWWGMSSGMVDIIYSKRIPSGTVQLIELLKKNICSGEFKPFSGIIYSQDEVVHNVMEEGITAEEIITMDWLADNIIGSIPAMDELIDEAIPIVEVQGVAKVKESVGGNNV